MDFAESPEHEMLRAAVRDVAAKFGHEYFAEQARTGGRADELWQAIAELGLPRRAPPEEYGGGGGGMSELAIVCEELAAQGCPLLLILVSPAICAELIPASAPTRSRTGGCRRMAAGDEDGVRDHRARRRSNSHNIATTAHARRRRVPAQRHPRPTSPASTKRRAMVVVTRTGHRPRDRAAAQLSLFVVDTDAPGLERTLIPVEIARAREAVHAVLRRRRGAGRPPARRRGRRPAPGVRRAEPRAHHERVDLHRHRPVRARPRAPRTRTSARCGACRSAATRASRTRSRSRRSRSSSRA